MTTENNGTIPEIRGGNLFKIEFVFRALLEDIGKSAVTTRDLTDAQLSMLNFLFPSSAALALDCIDRERLSVFTTSSNDREAYQVRTSTLKFYTMFQTLSFCDCSDFEEKVLTNRKEPTCQHILAVHLAKAMNRPFRKVVYTETQWIDFVSSAYF